MKTIPFFLLFLSAVAFGQHKHPAGMENYEHKPDSNSYHYLDIYPNDQVLYTYILYDSIDGNIDVINLDMIWLEFNRILNANKIHVEDEGFSLLVSVDFKDMPAEMYFSIFDLIQGYNNIVQRYSDLDSDNLEDPLFGFNIEKDGWSYEIIVTDGNLYTTVSSNDLATVQKYQKKYPSCVQH